MLRLPSWALRNGYRAGNGLFRVLYRLVGQKFGTITYKYRMEYFANMNWLKVFTPFFQTFLGTFQIYK